MYFWVGFHETLMFKCYWYVSNQIVEVVLEEVLQSLYWQLVITLLNNASLETACSD